MCCFFFSFCSLFDFVQLGKGKCNGFMVAINEVNVYVQQRCTLVLRNQHVNLTNTNSNTGVFPFAAAGSSAECGSPTINLHKSKIYTIHLHIRHANPWSLPAWGSSWRKPITRTSPCASTRARFKKLIPRLSWQRWQKSVNQVLDGPGGGNFWGDITWKLKMNSRLHSVCKGGSISHFHTKEI